MAGRVLAEIGHPDAQRIQEEVNAYRAELLRAVREAVARRALVKLKDET